MDLGKQLKVQVLLGFLLSANITFGTNTNVVTWSWSGSVLESAIPQMPTNIIALAGSDYHCVALLADRTVIVWGQNNHGQTNVPIGSTNIVGIAAGNYNSLAVNGDGVAKMWGVTALLQPGFVPPEATNVAALGVGRGALHSVALRRDGSVVDWGWAATPVPPEAMNIVSVAAGSYHSLALRSDGRVISWGANPNTAPADATNIVAIAAGDNTSVAVRMDGTLLKWGNIQAPPASATNVIEVGCFQSGGGIALRRDGTAFGWGAPVTIQTTNIMTVGADSWGALAVKASGAPVFPLPVMNRAVAAGQNAYFRLWTVGALPMSYAWSFFGTNLPAATNQVLVITNAQSGHRGPYTLTVSNSLGVVTSEPMYLNVEPLEVTVQPISQTVFGGSNATFTASTVGQGPFSFQWSLGNQILPDATNSTLVLTNVAQADVGNYFVAVSNSLGGAVSSGASLVMIPLVISSQPQGATVLAGSNVNFSVLVSGTPPFTYQWRFGGVALNGATNATLLLNNVQTNQSGAYSVSVSNSYGGRVSSSATLTVVPLAIQIQPTNVTALLLSPAVFSVSPSGEGPFTYQWSFNGSNLLNATDSVLILTNVHLWQAGAYSVVISNAHGALSSDPAILSLRQVEVWGDSGAGQASYPAGLTNIIAIAAGYFHTTALRSDRKALAWGSSFSVTNVPPIITNVISIAAGGFHNIALKADGTVDCWGAANYGAIDFPPNLSNIVAVAGGQYHSLALRSDGKVIAWGAGTTNSGVWPDLGQSVVPDDLSNVVAISAKGDFSLALKDDGTLVAWGANDSRQTNVPESMNDFIGIAAGFSHGAALRSAGSIVSWGGNNFGQTNSPQDLTNIVSLAAGVWNSLALDGNNHLVVWGRTDYGQTNVPPKLSNITAISGGNYHIAALVSEELEPSKIYLTNAIAGIKGFKISIPTISGRVYRLEHIDSLSDTAWVAHELVAGTGGLIDLTDNSPPGLQRFYRVRRW